MSKQVDTKKLVRLKLILMVFSAFPLAEKIM